MIYGRFGNRVTIIRLADASDIRELEGRVIDRQDREALKNGSYVIVQEVDDGRLRLYHQAFLRADGGLGEISDAIKAAGYVV